MLKFINIFAALSTVPAQQKKAFAGGIAGLLGVLAAYGVQDGFVVDTLQSLETSDLFLGVVAYVFGHMITFATSNSK